jgi:hypothetical protein
MAIGMTAASRLKNAQRTSFIPSLGWADGTVGMGEAAAAISRYSLYSS